MLLSAQPLWRRCLVRWFGYVSKQEPLSTWYEFRRNLYLDVRL